MTRDMVALANHALLVEYDLESDLFLGKKFVHGFFFFLDIYQQNIEWFTLEMLLQA